MPTNFPTSLDSFTTRVNNIDTIDASHVNNLQDSVLAIETLLGAASVRRTVFTPTFTFATTAPTGITYGTANTGFYAQMGSMVFVHTILDVTGYTGGSGNLVINIPTTAANVAQAIAGMARGASGFVTAWPTGWSPTANTVNGNLFSVSSSAVPVVISSSNVTTAGFQVRFSGTYFQL